jgi:dienelactone hydrolase
MQTRSALFLLILGLGLISSNLTHAQPPGITMEMINTTLPLEGAPPAEAGPFAIITETAFDNARYLVHRPRAASELENSSLPLVIWGNGGCAIDGSRYGEFLQTIASHGFVVMTTQALANEERRSQTPSDLKAAIDWAERENSRLGAALQGRINLEKISVMGQSCGGFLSVSLGTDSRVDTIGVFNSGVQNGEATSGDDRATTGTLANVHGPILFINGGERDFMLETSRANFDKVNHVPTFYGARANAGHTATVYHPGGGEYANVASHWLRYILLGDENAGRMFKGANCELCLNGSWETASKSLP